MANCMVTMVSTKSELVANCMVTMVSTKSELVANCMYGYYGFSQD
jgi:hypothetical protein